MLKNVLIVEDQAAARAGLPVMVHIAEPHCRVTEARSHSDALLHLAKDQFDVVFLDIDLGALETGLDVLRHIRDQDFLCKVILLSDSEEREKVMKCISAGASGYIVNGQRDANVFGQALATVFDEGVVLPTSLIGGDYGVARESRNASDLGLSLRLCEVLFYTCHGQTNKSIAKKLQISEAAVRKEYISELLRFFNVARRTDLIIEVARRCIRVTAVTHDESSSPPALF